MAFVRDRYPDFSATLAVKKLVKRLRLTVSRKTLRKWMQNAALWLPGKQRRTFSQPRLCRKCTGKLIQIDGLGHRWFEDRGPVCFLLVYH